MLFDSRSRSAITTTAALLIVIFSFGADRSEVRAGHTSGPDNTPADLPAAIELGAQSERSRRWIDAIDAYEKAIKHWPDSADLKYGLRRSKIHFGIERRYDDASFDDQMLRMRREPAIKLLEAVLEHIQFYYVDEITPTSFVAHGTESLYLALANEKFLHHNLRGVDPERIARLRRTLRDKYWNRPVMDYPVASQAVASVCDLAAAETGLSDGAVVLEYIFGGCNCLDDYSNFLTPDRLKDLEGNINGEFVGLGIEMKAEHGKGMLLVNILPESPAQEGGLQAGEYITGIDGANCLDMSTDEAAKLLRGRQGSSVSLRIQSPDRGPRDERFSRRAVEVKSIPIAEIIDRKQGIGYIRMTAFQATSPRELDAALNKLSRQGMRSVIWDLRGNPGGLLPSATSVLDRFIGSGVLVSTRSRSIEQNESYSASPRPKLDIPLALLVDEDSASASEIVAGAVHDHKRGTVIGRTTYGKWSVQTIFRMPNGGGLRLTTAKFYSPAGRNLAKVGLRPDLVVNKVESTHTAYKNPALIENLRSEDPDVKAALGVLSGQYQKVTGR